MIINFIIFEFKIVKFKGKFIIFKKLFKEIIITESSNRVRNIKLMLSFNLAKICCINSVTINLSVHQLFQNFYL